MWLGLLLTLCHGPMVAEIPRWKVAPDHPELVYTGRWDFSDPKNPSVGWQGASVAMTFDGTSIGMALDPGFATEWCRIILDGDVVGSTKLRVDPGGVQEFTLARGLSPGKHHIEVVKETYVGTAMRFLGFGGAGGTGPLPSPPRPQRKIVFYGDSNLAGYSLEHEENQGDTQYRGCSFTYAGIAARRLGAEYHNISASGETIGSLHNRYDRMSWWTSTPKWDFGRFVPDLVVVNVGANDVGRPEASIRADYHAFLDDLRQAHPLAHIVMFNARGWDYDEPANYTDQVVAARNDPNLSAAVFPWVFEQWHGCETDHSGMADYLVEHVQSVLGWTPAATDVVSGYGRNGDVANGSFEAIAPFGGFGWRYGAHRSQVRRVRNAGLAHDGDYWIALLRGASIQQPNPVQPGQTVTVELWLRGKQASDEAVVTIDFRDQEMFTSPLQTQSWALPLTTSWTRHVIQATAPTGGPRPVYHSRLTVAAQSQSRVGVDSVSMTVQ